MSRGDDPVEGVREKHSGRPRVAAAGPFVPGQSVPLSAAAVAHLRVLRLGAGFDVEVFDGNGQRAHARLVTTSDGGWAADVVSVSRDRASTALHLIQAVPKGAKIDTIVRMVTELGVHGVHLVNTEHVVARWDSQRIVRRVERLSRVATEAARQCGRNLVPRIMAPDSLEVVLGRISDGDGKVLFWEHATAPLGTLDASPVQWVVVGAEGGLSQREADQLVAAGFLAVTMGETILRVETAAPVAIALIQDRLKVSVREGG